MYTNSNYINTPIVSTFGQWVIFTYSFPISFI